MKANPSKYLHKFKGKDFTKHMIITGDALLVEQVTVEEIKTKSGLIIDTGVNNTKQIGSIATERPVLVHVLAVGAGHYSEDGTHVPVSVSVGDILMVGQASVRWFPTFGLEGYQPFEIGITRESEAQIIWNGQEGYNNLCAALNQSESTS